MTYKIGDLVKVRPEAVRSDDGSEYMKVVLIGIGMTGLETVGVETTTGRRRAVFAKDILRKVGECGPDFTAAYTPRNELPLDKPAYGEDYDF